MFSKCSKSMKSTSLIELAGAKHVTGGGQCGTGPIYTMGGYTIRIIHVRANFLEVGVF